MRDVAQKPGPTLRAEPVTHEAFAPYGDLIQGSWNPSSAPAHVAVNTVTANPQTAYKYNRLSRIESSYPPTSGAVTAIAVYRATPPAGLGHGQVWQVRMFERHAFTTQAFIPMAKGEWGAGVGESAMARTEGEGGMLVIVALNGPDDQPDLTTLKAFLTSPSQGIAYRTGIWHHSVLSLSPTDYAAIDTQVTTDSSTTDDCEVLRRPADAAPWASIEVPHFGPSKGHSAPGGQVE